MKLNKEVPSWAWEFYRAFQIKASRTSNEADEEVLNFIVRLIENEKLPGTEVELERMVNNHLAGHRQKLRRRTLLFERYAIDSELEDADTIATSRESIEIIRKLITVAQWQVLYEIATGRSYIEISKASKVPVGTVKSLVSRARTKLRDSSERLNFRDR